MSNRAKSCSGLALAAVVMFAAGCAHHSQAAHDGAVTGGLIGAVAGGVLTNSVEGAVVGGLLGAVIGNELGEQADRDAREAARTRQTVVHVSDDHSERVEARPIGYVHATECHRVHRRIWQNGELVVDEIVEVCESFD